MLIVIMWQSGSDITEIIAQHSSDTSKKLHGGDSSKIITQGSSEIIAYMLKKFSLSLY